MIIYKDDIKDIDPDSLEGFFEGWKQKPTNQKFYTILKNSTFIELAIDTENNTLAGFVTAISDQILSAYIPLLEVLPEYRGQGIGSELIKRILKKLDDIYMIDLICDNRLAAFYGKLGFIKTQGMSLRQYSAI